MLHAKSQDQKTFGSAEEDFTIIYWRSGYLDHVTWAIYIDFRPLSEEDSHEIWL